MKAKVWLLSLFLFSFAAANPHTLTIDDIVEITLKHSPGIDVSRFDFEGAKARTKAAKSYYLPHLDASASGGKQWSKLKNQSTGSTDLLTGSLGASQLLYDFGRTTGNINRTEEETLALEAQMQQIISDKIYIVKKLYYDVLKSKTIIDVQEKNYALQKKQLHRAKKYLLSGIKTIIDVSDAEVQVEQAKLDLENAHYEVELQRAALEEAMGYVPYNGDYRLYRKKLALPHLSRTLPQIRTSLGKLEAYAYKHRYVLNSSEHFVKSAAAHVRSTRGDYYPSISVGGNYSTQKVDSSVQGMLPEGQGQIAVNMNWNLFSGFKTDADVQEAKINVLKASSQVQEVKLAIKKQVIESHIGLRRSKKNVQLSESIAQASLKKFEQAQKRYENDLSDYIELQDAQQGYIQSLSDLVNAYYEYYISLAQLDHSIGR